jgi:2-dehydro-3-deoxygluconokinase
MDVVSLGETMILFSPETTGQLRYAQNFSSKVAGAETNTLIGLAKLGYQTGWISRLGKDEFGKRILSTVRGEGVDVRYVTLDKTAPTGLFLKEKTNENSTRVFYYRKHSAATKIGPEDIQEAYIAEAKYLYVSGITPALSESCREAVFRAMDFAKKNGKRIVFDPNIRKSLWEEDIARKTLFDMAKKADIVIPGLNEGKFLFQTNDCEKIADEFKKLGAEMIIIKLGEKGAYYSTLNKNGYVNGFQVDRVIDPVGAGDGFAAGVLSGILDELSIEEAVKRGCAIGAMVTTVNGDIEGLPDKETLQDFMSLTKKEDVIR